MENYQIAQDNIIKMIDQFIENPNKTELLGTIIDKYFKTHHIKLLLEVDEIIDNLKSQNKYNLVQIIDYIQFIYNYEIYNILLNSLLSSEKAKISDNDKLIFLGIIWTEHNKYSNYEIICKLLDDHIKDNPHEINDNIITLLNASKKRCDDCISKIKEVFTLLITKFPEFDTEIKACKEIITLNGLYKIE